MQKNTPTHTIRLNNRLLDLSTPRVMGIINVTPDSFYSGSRKTSQREIFDKAEQMISEGVDILDIGGQSTRPGAQLLSEVEEWDRLRDVLPDLRKSFPDVGISLDTFYAGVAKRGADEGVDIINDVSGGNLDAEMFDVVGQLRLPYILMHSRGNAQTMTDQTEYDNVVEDVISDLHQKVYKLRHIGVADIILDPGFGFAKTTAQSFEIMANLNAFHIFGLPILVGISRKSMVYKTLGVEPEESLHGTTALHFWCISRGVCILRVHDVRPAKDAIKMYMALQT
ncbi:MAG: dihydropteroate synthase [Cryomorphaceae bacterium]|nr:dihydropteroate synthase [Cryomorphaceae bacterium]